MTHRTAITLLDAIAADRGLVWSAEAKPADDGGEMVTAEVFDPNGPERWTATAPDLYQAACVLSVMLGWDLEG